MLTDAKLGIWNYDTKMTEYTSQESHRPTGGTERLCTGDALRPALCASDVYARTENFRVLQNLNGSLLSGTMPKSNFKASQNLVCLLRCVLSSEVKNTAQECHLNSTARTRKGLATKCMCTHMSFYKVTASVLESNQLLCLLVLTSEQRERHCAVHKSP